MAYLGALLLIACIILVGVVMNARRRYISRPYCDDIADGFTTDSGSGWMFTAGDSANAHSGSCDSHSSSADCGGGHH